MWKIDNINKNEYKEVVKLWEASVRATHDFLKEEDIEFFKPLILNTYLDAVQLKCIRINNKIIGFLGVADHNLEMLFIHPEFIGKRIGKTLLEYAIENLNVTNVDVNEQNKQAVEFYKHCGFEIIGHSELDASGKPYPILHLAVASIKK